MLDALLRLISRVRIKNVLLVMGLVAVAGSFWNIAASARSSPGADPSTEPIPVFDFDDPSKSMVINVQFNSPTDVDFISAVVSIGRHHANIGDPPLIGVELFDDEGALIDQFNAWHPLWQFQFTEDGGEALNILPSGTGRFVIPFYAELATMRLRDIPMELDLIEVDLTPAIDDFCDANPYDPDCDSADLEMLEVTPLSTSRLVPLGQHAELEVRMTFTNNGPDGPVDADVSITAVADPGLSVIPVSADFSEPALALDEERSREQTFEVECLAPGLHSITFTAGIGAIEPTIGEPDETNNQEEVTQEVDCAVPVIINIKPHALPNSINGRGNIISVAALSTAAGEYGQSRAFDATVIDPLSLRFGPRALVGVGGGAREVHSRIHVEDSWELDERTRDGDRDVVGHFSAQESGVSLTDTEGCLTGRYDAGGGEVLSFIGCDSVRITK